MAMLARGCADQLLALRLIAVLDMQKTNTTSKTLILHRETLRVLDRGEPGVVAGGSCSSDTFTIDKNGKVTSAACQQSDGCTDKA